MSKTGNFIAGLFTGAMAGTVLALLYAPDTGKNTRDRLSYRLSNYRDELNELISELRKENKNLFLKRKKKVKLLLLMLNKKQII